jgi:hypothetical protein
MDSNNILIIIIAILILALLASLSGIFKKETSVQTTPSADPSTKMMQLQAYERLVLLVERIALPNLIARVGQAGISAREMQLLLTQNIRHEFDYNISQQVYVSADAWNAVKTLKEQNLLVINQFANTLPYNATGLDLNKQLLDYLLNDKKGSLHEVVSNVVSIEAKKIL